MAFRRDALVACGGFDERLGAGTRFPCEDIDAAARLLWAGHFGMYDPTPTVRHHHRRRPGPELDALLESYDRGRGAYWMKYLLHPASRGAYARAWLRSIRRDVAHDRRIVRSRREVRAALQFLRTATPRPFATPDRKPTLA